MEYYIRGDDSLDHEGLVFTIDTMFALLIITVIIGISANAMEIAGMKARDYSTEQSIERITGDTADILIKTPGSPVNWDRLKSLKSVTPGLAKDENGTKKTSENIISMKKLLCLKKNPELLKKILPPSMSCSLTIYPIDTNLSIIQVLDETPTVDTGDVSVVNRTIIYDYMAMESYLSIKPDIDAENDLGAEYICTHSELGNYRHNYPNFKKRNAGWICRPFYIDLLDMESKDFYILTDPKISNDNTARWIIDAPDCIYQTSQSFTTNPILVNSKISELSRNKSREIFVLHVYTSGNPEKLFNTYIVGVPKKTPLKDVKIDSIKPQPAFFILKLWM